MVEFKSLIIQYIKYKKQHRASTSCLLMTGISLTGHIYFLFTPSTSAIFQEFYHFGKKKSLKFKIKRVKYKKIIHFEIVTLSRDLSRVQDILSRSRIKPKVALLSPRHSPREPCFCGISIFGLKCTMKIVL